MNYSQLRESYFGIILIVILTLTFHALGQFSVVSSIPVNGATEVDTAETMTIVFNAPIDTSARFLFPENFFLNIYFYPDSLVGEPDSITMSPDLTTVYVHNLHFAENTTYIFIIINAVNQTGDSLSAPYSTVFTTGNSLPTNTISGVIDHPEDEPEGTFVFLLEANPFESEDDTPIITGTPVTSPTGEYTIPYVEAGTYWPAAIKHFFIDDNMEIEFQEGSTLGLYDSNGDNNPDSIVVPPSQTDVNITLTQITPKTARQAYSLVETSTQLWAADAALIQLGGDPQADGFSLFWNFLFYSPSIKECKTWYTMGDFIVESQFVESFCDTLAIPTNWLDSDQIMTIAENNGGSDFREEYPNSEIFAYLGYPIFNDTEALSNTSKINMVNSNVKWKNQNSIKPIELCESMKAVAVPAIWYIDYHDNDYYDDFYIVIDAVTGEVLSKPTTAAIAEEMALSVAQEWANDVELWAIYAPEWAGLDSLGNSTEWYCFYYSPSVDSFHIVVVQGILPLMEGSFDENPPDTTTLEDNWIDSDDAIFYAEENGGNDYRKSNQNVFVSASLGRWWDGNNPLLTVWRFYYYSMTAEMLEIIVDAVNGGLVAGIDNQVTQFLPDQFELLPNYPNPFNPSTAIQFTIPKLTEVKLFIYNTLGQKVATLVNEYLPAGYHKISWYPDGLAAGVYIISLQAGDFRNERMIHLIK